MAAQESGEFSYLEVMSNVLIRNSIGQQFALIEASYTTIRILQAFKGMERRDNSELKEILSITMSVRPGVKVGLTPA